MILNSIEYFYEARIREQGKNMTKMTLMAML